jgi:hypothetical protein
MGRKRQGVLIGDFRFWIGDSGNGRTEVERREEKFGSGNVEYGNGRLGRGIRPPAHKGLTKKMNIEHRTLNVQHRIMIKS